MEMQKIDGSSLIAATGYDADTQTMRIEFTDGKVYRYSGVPPEVHADLRAGGEAGSVGKTFHSTVRGVYASEAEPESEEGGA